MATAATARRPTVAQSPPRPSWRKLKSLSGSYIGLRRPSALSNGLLTRVCTHRALAEAAQVHSL